MQLEELSSISSGCHCPRPNHADEERVSLVLEAKLIATLQLENLDVAHVVKRHGLVGGGLTLLPSHRTEHSEQH